jgi:formamidopyrimidine-DNA glycosylase
MPEGCVTLRSADRITQKLKPGENWLYFVDIYKYGDSFSAVDITNAIPALNQRVLNFFCKGKEYFFFLANHVGIRAHMRMEGHWTFEKPDNLKHVHFRLDFCHEPQHLSPDVISLYYINTRLGEFELFTNHQSLIERVNRIAPGFIGQFILPKEAWLSGLATLKQTSLLWDIVTDQKKLCSGIGNYLRAECFWHTRLNPYTRLNQISIEERAWLYDVFTAVVDGHYRKTLQKVIYMHKISPNGHPIVSEKSKGKQTVWYSPIEQPLRP